MRRTSSGLKMRVSQRGHALGVAALVTNTRPPPPLLLLWDPEATLPAARLLCRHGSGCMAVDQRM